MFHPKSWNGELKRISLHDIGLIIALLGAYLASIGNVVGVRNAKSGVPVTQANVYVMLLMPIVALILSTFFEEYQWSVNAVLGVIVVLVGNLINLTPADTVEKAFRKLERYSTLL